MFRVKDGMSLKAGDRVEVYYNIQKGGFSILSLEKGQYGKVVAYAPQVFIEGATFHINAKKLERILSMKRKTVYATIKGTYIGCDEVQTVDHRQGYCNPYTTGKFIDWESKTEIKAAAQVYFYDKFFSYKEA